MAAPPRGKLMRTASAEQVSLQHPAPGLESLQGAYLKNVERLEQSAEEMSQGGSDIGEEIRKMKHEQDRASRRSSSIASREGRQPSISAVLSTRSRAHSTSSYANSIVDVNTQARWGGYSPGGYVTSPTVSRVSSFHRPSGMPEPVQEGRPLDSPLASPTSVTSPHRQPSHYSLAPTDEETFEPDHHHGANDQDEEETYGLDHQAGHDQNKTPEPGHQDWEGMSTRSDQDEQSHYSQSHYSQSIRHSNDNDRQEEPAHIHYAHDILEQEFDNPNRAHDQEFEQTPHVQGQEFAQGREFAHGQELGNIHDMHEQEFQHMQPQDPQAYAHHYSYHGMDHAMDHQNDPYRPSTPPDRPQTADTYRQARSLFKDFDGVHYSPNAADILEDQVQHPRARPQQQNRMSNARLSRGLRMSYAQPPPGEQMVYYPAPVPRMLNLPKRLSQQPPSSAQAKRRSEVLKTIPAEARQSAPWLPALDFEQQQQQQQQHEEQDQHNKSPVIDHPQSPNSLPAPSPAKQRRSMMDPQLNRMSTANLPPQLRASVFFDQQGAPQTDVQIKHSSAVATLDSILAASVNAPVNVFVDHPFAGNVSRDVYAQERPAKRRSTTLANLNANTTDSPAKDKKGHDRSVSTGTIEAKPAIQKRQSVMSILTDMGKSDGKKLKKRNSRMSLATDLDMDDIGDGATEAHKSRPVSRQDVLDNENTEEGAEEQLEDEEDEEDEDFDERGSEQDMNMPFFAQPTTLLAELQTRKAHQKSRNRNAATNYPNGMHSTLMQLDAVAQVEKKKRQNQRTRLAWEDPAVAEAEQQREDEDEDVPLGVLYNSKQTLVSKLKAAQQSDWDRPLGLMEKREMEDNEPLSNRRFRLKGIPPGEALRIRQEQEMLRREANLPPPEAVPLPGEEDENDDPDEPLAQRLRRLKQKEALSSALGDLAKAGNDKSAFSEDVLSSFGGLNVDAKDSPSAQPSVVEPEEETLGQRRARLQREREQQQQNHASDPSSLRTVRPPLTTSPSLANLLAANPIGPSSGKARSANAPIAGSLLAESAKTEDEARRKLRERNAERSTSYNRLVGGMPPAMATSKTAPNVISQNPAAGYFPPQPPVMYPAHMLAGGGMAAPHQQYGYNPYLQQPAYTAQGYGYNGAAQQAPVATNTATYASMAQWQGSGNLQDLNLNPQQRDLIDRWRLSIAQ